MRKRSVLLIILFGVTSMIILNCSKPIQDIVKDDEEIEWYSDIEKRLI